MLILGIDPGLALTGWAVVEKKDSPKLIKYGCIRTLKDQQPSERIKQLYEELEQIIKKYQPTIMAIEKLFFNTNAKTASIVSEARGIIKICGVLNKLVLVEFTPLQIKNSVVGYGRASKNQVQQMVKSLLNLDDIPRPDDAADAVAVALTCCFYNQALE